MAIKTYFGALAADYISESGRDIQDVAAAIGKTPPSQFSKWKAGRWTYIAPEKLLRIIDEIAGRDRQKRVSLMVAYLVDMTPDEFKPLLKIVPQTGEPEGNPVLAGQRWSPSLRKKLEEIGAAYARNDDFMRMIDQYGTWAAKINRDAGKKG